MSTWPPPSVVAEFRQMVDALTRLLETPGVLHFLRHHAPEQANATKMHAAYDRRRQARRKHR